MVIALISVALAGYLIGSVPGSLWVGRWFYNVDLRQHGSGNPGATNAFRVLGWKAGLMSTVIDMGKGYVAAGIIPQLLMAFGWITVDTEALEFWLMLAGGGAAVIGHMFPIWARFKGGKGVNTAAGILIAITPLNMLIVFSVFFLVVWRTRYVSLSSMLASFSYPVSLIAQKYLFGQDVSTWLILFGTLLATGIILAHHTNIRRLLKGTENKISWVQSPRPAENPST